MDYRVFSASSGEEDSSTEAHVFARAYRTAWRSAYASDPVGRHRVDGLELIIDFGVPAPANSRIRNKWAMVMKKQVPKLPGLKVT